MWTDAHQANNEANLARQDVLAKAWKNYAAEAEGRPEEEFVKGWQSARVSALEKAKELPVWRDW